MAGLGKLQSDFQRYLVQAGTGMETHIVGTEQIDATARLAIYGDAYRIRLLEALDANYPALHKQLGDDAFRALGEAYIAAHPSRHYSIRWFGHRLAEFMIQTAPWNEQRFAQELTAFEWATSEAFDAADGDVVVMEHMATVPPETWPAMHFEFHPSLRQLPLYSNAPAVWYALTHDQSPESSQVADSASAWIAWRQNLSLYYRALEIDEAWALDAAVRGETFAALCEGLCEWIDAEHVALRAAGFLRQWIGDGLISRIDA